MAVILIALLATGILSIFYIKAYAVVSGSMEPKIPTHSLAFIDTSSPYEDVKTGDIVLYCRSNSVRYVHRVISVTENGIETKGDANDNSDGIAVHKWNYLGICIKSVPYLGYVLEWIGTVQGKMVYFLFVISGLWIILKQKKKHR